MGSKGGASHHCSLILASILDSLGPGSALGKEGKNVWVEFVVCSLLATRGFSTAEHSVLKTNAKASPFQRWLKTESCSNLEMAY